MIYSLSMLCEFNVDLNIPLMFIIFFSFFSIYIRKFVTLFRFQAVSFSNIIDFLFITILQYQFDSNFLISSSSFFLSFTFKIQKMEKEREVLLRHSQLHQMLFDIWEEYANIIHWELPKIQKKTNHYLWILSFNKSQIIYLITSNRINFHLLMLLIHASINIILFCYLDICITKRGKLSFFIFSYARFSSPSPQWISREHENNESFRLK